MTWLSSPSAVDWEEGMGYVPSYFPFSSPFSSLPGCLRIRGRRGGRRRWWWTTAVVVDGGGSRGAGGGGGGSERRASELEKECG